MCAFLAPQVLSLVVLSVPILCLSELCPSLWSERSRQDEEEDKVQQRHPMVWPRVMCVVFLVMPWQRGITNPFPVLSTFSLISHCKLNLMYHLIIYIFQTLRSLSITDAGWNMTSLNISEQAEKKRWTCSATLPGFRLHPPTLPGKRLACVKGLRVIRMNWRIIEIQFRFLRGNCPFSALSCPYSHNKDQAPLCLKWKAGECTGAMGNKCVYRQVVDRCHVLLR